MKMIQFREHLSEGYIEIWEPMSRYGEWISIDQNGIVYGNNEPCKTNDQEDIEFNKEVKACREWLQSNALKTKRMNGNHSSYGLKHVVEAERGYICNGAFIHAAMDEGYTGYWDGTGPNCYFNMAFGVVYHGVILK